MTSDSEEAAMEHCLVCDAPLDYSVSAAIRGYCDVCKPDHCAECGCVNIRRDLRPESPEGRWVCDNGCSFEVVG